MKISQIEETIIQGNASIKTIDLYKSALKKVPYSHRCQHCYTTAVSMKPRLFEQAIGLIEYGLTFCDSWQDKMRAYHNMAIIYENHNDFTHALLSYKEALNAVDPDKTESYVPQYSGHMLRAEMHISGFEYTDDIRHYYNLANQADGFCQSFLREMYYSALAETILSIHDGKVSEAKLAIEKAEQILCPDYIGPLTALLKRKGYIEKAGATKESLSFLRRAKKEIRK